MSIKLAVLQDQDQVIAEIKEVVDEGKPIGYLFANAHRIILEKQFLAETDDDRQNSNHFISLDFIIGR